MAKIALITRDEALAVIILNFMKEEKHEVARLSEYSEEVAIRASGGFDIVVIDESDIKYTGKFTKYSSPKHIIIVDGMPPDLVEIKICGGVWDCIPKPLSHGGNFIESTVDAFKNNCIKSCTEAIKANSKEYYISDLDKTKIIGESQVIKSCLASLIPAIASDQSILLMGDSGTGKELFAEVVHENSSLRKNGPFMAFNCASVPEDMADSILFGYMKGSHSKADRDTEGLIESADKGTLFLDEIGELSPNNQARLLRCIQEKEVLRLGASKPIKTDFRLVAATNVNVNEMIKKRKFRQDLFFRVAAFTIFIPSLKERKEDIQAIADHYIKKICGENNISPPKTYTDDFMEALYLYDWPGNVRELINEIQGSIFRSGKTSAMNVYNLSIHIKAFWAAYSKSRQFDIPQATRDAINNEFIDRFVNEMETAFKGPTVSIKFIPGQTPTLTECKDKLEREYLKSLKNMADKKQMKVEKVSKLAGLSKQSYYRLISKHKLNS